MRGTRPDGSTLMRKGGAPVYSAFFQQSSFATHAIANERYMVKVRKDAPLELLGPFACSGQTGAGAVLNSMQPRAGDSFAVFGVGAVGLSASDGGQNSRLRSDHRRRRARRPPYARARARRYARDQSPRTQRRGRGNPQDHRRRRALLARDIGAACRLPRSGGGADRGRYLRSSRQRAQRHGGVIRHAVPAVRPGGARRDPGRKPPAGVHPDGWSISSCKAKCRSNG